VGDVRVKRSFQLHKLDKFIAHDPKLIFTLVSYAVILAIYVNLNTFKSPAIGLIAFVSYFLINAIFLSHTFFEKEDVFFRLMFGVLLLIMLLGLVGWLIMIIYNLDVIKFTLVLFVVATLSSSLNRRIRTKNAT
jgi:hypothetical protein